MEEKICRDIIKNSYYMLCLFEREEKTITNLKLQKLMYFVEALYMCKHIDERKLFDSEWIAWNYGPVSLDLYNKFKTFGSMNITLSNNEEEIAEDLPNINKDFIKKIYNSFGQLEAFQLVTLTHLKGSPWYKIKQENRYNLDSLNNNAIISKSETKKWFEEEFGEIFKDNV